MSPGPRLPLDFLEIEQLTVHSFSNVMTWVSPRTILRVRPSGSKDFLLNTPCSPRVSLALSGGVINASLRLENGAAGQPSLIPLLSGELALRSPEV